MPKQCYRSYFSGGKDISRHILQLYASTTKYFGLLDLDVQYILKHHNFDVAGYYKHWEYMGKHQDIMAYDIPKLYTQLFAQRNILLVY